MGTGVVTAGSKAGTATIKATAGGKCGVRPGRRVTGRAEAADDGVVQAGFLVEDREAWLPGELASVHGPESAGNAKMTLYSERLVDR